MLSVAGAGAAAAVGIAGLLARILPLRGDAGSDTRGAAAQTAEGGGAAAPRVSDLSLIHI